MVLSRLSKAPSSLIFTGIAVCATTWILARWARRRHLSRKRARFAKDVAKIELHCHLGGSVRLATLLELGKNKLDDNGQAFLKQLQDDGSRSMQTCFKLFDLIYKVIDNREAIRRVLRELLIDLSADNVFYAEIRSSPREMADGTTRSEYIALLLDEVRKYLKSRADDRQMNVRLLISINRADPVEKAWETYSSSKTMMASDPDKLICGFDFCGHPAKGNFLDFLPVMEAIRSDKLKITVHTAEISAREDETDSILAFRPDRLGHAYFVNAAQMNCIMETRTPVEICPTSNMKTVELSTMKDHLMLDRCIRYEHPFSINTDDGGVVFNTLPSNELFMVADYWEWSTNYMASFCEAVVSTTFLPVEEQDILRDAMLDHNRKLAWEDRTRRWECS